MEVPILKLIESVEHCLSPKLIKGLDESENHTEFGNQTQRLSRHFPTLLKLLEEVELRGKDKLSLGGLTSLFILYKELKSDGPWNSAKATEYSKRLKQTFQLLYDVSLGDILKQPQCFNFNPQDIFNEVVDKLHLKLSSDNLKKYPSLVEVYCSMIEDVMNCKVKVNASRTFPITLLLLDEYVVTYKIKGLRCCNSILFSLSPEDFQHSNYYEIIYGSLKKVFLEQDLQVTKLACECLMNLVKLLPTEARSNKSDQLHTEVLDQLLIEANLYRKAELFNFAKNLIEILQVDCVKKKKKFSTLINDNLESCCTEGVAEILLIPIIECYEQWLKHCWCNWDLNRDHKLLNVLFKVLYVCKTEQYSNSIIHLLINLISLCKKEERMQIMKSLDRGAQIKCETFNNYLFSIKKHFV